MKVFVGFSRGAAIVDRSKIIFATSAEVERDVLEALRKPHIDDGEPIVDNGRIIEGVISRLRPGTVEFDEKALSRLPNAVVTRLD